MCAAALAVAAALALAPALASAQAPPPTTAGQALKAGAQAIGRSLSPQDPSEAPAPAPAAPAVAAPPAVAPAPGSLQAPGQAAVPGQLAQPAAPGGLLVPGSEFRYNPTGRRDPFKSLLQLEKKQRDISQLPPIQQFDLDNVNVVGIVDDPGRGAQAMIRAPNGQTFVVRVGTIVGKNDGEVVEITLKGIRIIEKFLDFMNRETRKETFLKSHSTAGK